MGPSHVRRVGVFEASYIVYLFFAMPQGKIKVKAQMPASVRGKKVKKLDKAPPERKVKHNPIGPAKIKKIEADKMRKTISKELGERLVAQVSGDGHAMSVIGRKAAKEAKEAKAASSKATTSKKGKK